MVSEIEQLKARVAELEGAFRDRRAEYLRHRNAVCSREDADRADLKACAEALRTIWREFQDTEGIREEHDCESYTDPRTHQCVICPLEEMVESVLSRPRVKALIKTNNKD